MVYAIYFTITILCFNDFLFILGVVGAIDGTHIFVKVEKDQQDSYIDRYRRHSINLMAICDSNTLFTYTFVGFPGSAHDSRVSNGQLNNIYFVYLGVNSYTYMIFHLYLCFRCLKIQFCLKISRGLEQTIILKTT